MEQKQKDALWAQYTKQTHRLGRVLSLITVALLLGAPFVIGALLGAMAYQYYRKNIVVAIAPLVVMSVLFTLVPGLISSTSFMIILSGALAIGIAYTIYKKKKQEAQA